MNEVCLALGITAACRVLHDTCADSRSPQRQLLCLCTHALELLASSCSAGSCKPPGCSVIAKRASMLTCASAKDRACNAYTYSEQNLASHTTNSLQLVPAPIFPRSLSVMQWKLAQTLGMDSRLNRMCIIQAADWRAPRLKGIHPASCMCGLQSFSVAGTECCRFAL